MPINYYKDNRLDLNETREYNTNILITDPTCTYINKKYSCQGQILNHFLLYIYLYSRKYDKKYWRCAKKEI